MQSKIHIIIKTFFVIFLIAYLSLLYTSNNAKDIPITDISAAYENESTISTLQKKNRIDLKRFYQIDDNNIEGFVFFKSASPMSVDELMIVKAFSSNEASSLSKNAENHLSSQKRTFEGYGTDQMALLNKAKVGCRGKFVYYFCGNESNIWFQSFFNII